MNDLVVNLEKNIAAPIDKVFNAWLDPVLLTQFILPMPGMPEPEVSNHPEVGGAFTIIMQVGSDKVPHTGKYLLIERPNKLSFSWQSPCSTDGSTVTIVFSEIDENTTNVVLTHIKFIDEESCSDHEGGWTNILIRLNNMLKESMEVS